MSELLPMFTAAKVALFFAVYVCFVSDRCKCYYYA